MAARISNEWMLRPDGSSVAPGFDHGWELCMSCGEKVPHCHYRWSKFSNHTLTDYGRTNQ